MLSNLTNTSFYFVKRADDVYRKANNVEVYGISFDLNVLKNPNLQCDYLKSKTTQNLVAPPDGYFETMSKISNFLQEALQHTPNSSSLKSSSSSSSSSSSFRKIDKLFEMFFLLLKSQHQNAQLDHLKINLLANLAYVTKPANVTNVFNALFSVKSTDDSTQLTNRKLRFIECPGEILDLQDKWNVHLNNYGGSKQSNWLIDCVASMVQRTICFCRFKSTLDAYEHGDRSIDNFQRAVANAILFYIFNRDVLSFFFLFNDQDGVIQSVTEQPMLLDFLRVVLKSSPQDLFNYDIWNAAAKFHSKIKLPNLALEWKPLFEATQQRDIQNDTVRNKMLELEKTGALQQTPEQIKEENNSQNQQYLRKMLLGAKSVAATFYAGVMSADMNLENIQNIFEKFFNQRFSKEMTFFIFAVALTSTGLYQMKKQSAIRKRPKSKKWINIAQKNFETTISWKDWKLLFRVLQGTTTKQEMKTILDQNDTLNALYPKYRPQSSDWIFATVLSVLFLDFVKYKIASLYKENAIDQSQTLWKTSSFFQDKNKQILDWTLYFAEKAGIITIDSALLSKIIKWLYVGGVAVAFFNIFQNLAQALFITTGVRVKQDLPSLIGKMFRKMFHVLLHLVAYLRVESGDFYSAFLNIFRAKTPQKRLETQQKLLKSKNNLLKNVMPKAEEYTKQIILQTRQSMNQ